ncbi:glycosyltransferase family 4 protein [Niallia sp. JL1B1071]|uniref:teichuronic acid biosynthesis protein TuaC n=1 Tax=Niallia tiangongensis TaxID=3237105 RepID=UPI0037DDD96B
MKILWITSVYPSEENPGNGVFHETQVKALTSLGVEVTVINPIPLNAAIIRVWKKRYREKKLPYLEMRNGVNVYRPVYRATPGQLRWFQPDKRIAGSILKTLKKEKLNFDFIHAHFAMPSGGATRIVAAECQKPWLLTLHGSDVHIYPSFSRSSERIFQKTVKSADEVIAVGEHLAATAELKTGRKCTPLPIGIDLTTFKLTATSLLKAKHKEELALPKSKKIILYIGRLVKEKGIFELAEALPYLPEEYVVVYVGDGPEKERLQRQEMYNERLFLVGQIPNDKVREYLLASDIFILPSYSEGLPTVVIEAMALKIPIICTNVGGVPDLFGEYSNLLIQPRSVQEIVTKVKEFSDDPSLYEKVTDLLYQRVHTNYSADDNAKRLIEKYQEVAYKSINSTHKLNYFWEASK